MVHNGDEGDLSEVSVVFSIYQSMRNIILSINFTGSKPKFKIVVWLHSLKKIVPSSLSKPEKAMAPHSSALTWKIPGTEELGGLQSMGSRRVGHD